MVRVRQLRFAGGLLAILALAAPGAGSAPLRVTIGSMSATRTPGGVLVRWTTVAEFDTAGFRVLRTSGGGEKSADHKDDPVAVSDFIPAAGSPLVGAKYEWLDRTSRGARGIRYYLEEIDSFGRKTRYGPILPESMRVRPF